MPLTVILNSLGDAYDDWLSGIVGFIARITTDSSGVISFSFIYGRPIETTAPISLGYGGDLSVRSSLI